MITKITNSFTGLVVCLFFIGQLNAQEYNKREFRAAWIVTAYNVDWPSRAGLHYEEQQVEFIQQIDVLRKAGFNAVVVQIRTCGDAMYGKGRKEPWSKFLSGTQGIDPRYDPLEFMVEEAHKRGMEFHAWINIDRARFAWDSLLSPWHITNTKPEWLYQYGGNLYFNFGFPQVRDYLSSIPAEIAAHYDIDGIHLDEYYYPFPVKNDSINDYQTFRAFPNGEDDIHDWRRKNSEILVRDIYTKLKRVKPHLPFGVSPFPIWRNQEDDPRGSKTFAKTSSYSSLYADIDTWIRKGYVDYVAPQIYFTRQFYLAPYEELLSWWCQYDSICPIFVGHSAFRIGTRGSLGRDTFWTPDEMPAQVRLNRNYAGIDGSIFYSSIDLMKNRGGILDSLRNNIYKHPAIGPIWDKEAWKNKPLEPDSVLQEILDGHVKLYWQYNDTSSDKPFGFIIYRFNPGEYPNLDDASHISEIVPGDVRTWTDPKPLEGKTLYAITAYDRRNVESKPFMFYVTPETSSD